MELRHLPLFVFLLACHFIAPTAYDNSIIIMILMGNVGGVVVEQASGLLVGAGVAGSNFRGLFATGLLGVRLLLYHNTQYARGCTAHTYISLRIP